MAASAPNASPSALQFDRLSALARKADGIRPIAFRSDPTLGKWAGLDLPSRVGGSDLGASEMAAIFRDCGRIDLELRDLPGAAHARFLLQAPSRRFDPLLRAVANGSSYCAIAITEPDVGSDLHALTASAKPIDGGYRLDGVKEHISRIEECSHFIVFAGVKRGHKSPLLTAFVVPRDAAGLSVEPMAPMGMTNVSWGRVTFSGVAIDEGQRVGGEGQAISMFVRHFSYWRTMMAAAAIGCAQTAVDHACERMKSRNAFGGPIGRFTHLQQGLAEAVARLHMAWLLVNSVATGFDRRSWPLFDAAMAKAEGIEAAIFATDWAMRVHGASGYDSAVGIEKRLRDLLGLRVADGTTDVLRGQVARAILGEHLYELSLNRESQRTIQSDARRTFW